MNRFLLILFSPLCLFLSVHSQTYTVDNFSEFDLSLKWSAATGIRGETRNLFGLLLPVGWCVAGKGGDFTIAFSNGDTVKGQFAYCQFYSDYLSRNLETPAGYYWWGGRALDKITFSSRNTFVVDFSFAIVTNENTGDFSLKYATGEDPSNTINQLFVSEPFHVLVNNTNSFPAPKTYNWQSITGNFSTKYFADKDFDGFFERYYGWNGGDVGISTLLPDGRSVWTWGDYDCGVVNSQRNRLTELAQFLRNALMTQDGLDFSAFRLLTAGKNLGQIEPAIRCTDANGNPLPDGQEWYWPMGGHVYYRNGTPELQILLEHTVNAGGGQWGMQSVGVDVAVFSLPNLQLLRVAKDRYTGKVGFANIAFDDDDGVVYIYGERNFGICVSATFVARNIDGDLTGTWEFYDAATKNWTTTHDWAESDTDGWWNAGHQLLNNAIFVFKDGGKYFAFEQEPCFSPNSFVHVAASPVGPFTNRRKVGQLPAEITSNNFICYIPTLHQQFSINGELLYSVSKNYNGDFNRYGTNQSANYYLPYFFRVKNWRGKLNVVTSDLPAVPAVDIDYRLAAEYPAMDNDATTVFKAQMASNGVSLTGVLPQKTILRQYTITSAPDNPDSDPLHWQLLGSDDAENWSILDERYYAEFSERSQTNSYIPKIAKTCKYFRLNVLATKNSADLQIAEWQLFGRYVDFFYEGESAIKVIGQQDIHIYPNPVKNKLTIENGVGMIKNVQIFDISGRKIANGKLSDGKSIDVSFLSAGMYILKIETETGIQTFKFNKIF